MATKDWKLIKNKENETEFFNNFTKELIEIDRFKYKYFNIYQVSINTIIKKHFKIKKEALTYAKAYMKKY